MCPRRPTPKAGIAQTLKHPNIVRLYDVIETDKYIGIILEYASGGELFDHILAHRYLREKDACKLFSQLISGVWYIHQKKIVHRDLKLENLLLDRHRNVIITDFGFANRFEHRTDDLMQTSCGSPCYAAPELVISDGLYVGSAVDIWSCGVILYAMLAGYLPFDDDPANPDGDNINLLYKYIVNTPLSFPDYISAEARDLLSIMLVPDPARRADLPSIMAHRWLAPCAHNFNKSVVELERTAIEQHHQKRLAYQRQMKQAAQAQEPAAKMSRSQSTRPDGYSGTQSVGPPRSRSNRDHAYSQQAQPEYLYETSPEPSVYSTAPSASRRGFNSTIVLPTSTPMVEDDPFAPSPSQEKFSNVPGADGTVASNGTTDDSRKVNGSSPPASVSKAASPNKRGGGMRHTIQVEYGESEGQEPQQQKSSGRMANGTAAFGPSSPERERSQRKPSLDTTRSNSTKALPNTPSATVSRERSETITQRFASAQTTATSPVSIEVTGPPATPGYSSEEKAPIASEKMGSTSSKQSRHKKGLSLDKIGISKLFGASPEQPTNGVQRAPSQNKKSSRTPSKDTITNGKTDSLKRPSTLQVPVSPASPGSSEPAATLSPDGSISAKKSRRNTLTVMVEPISRTIKQRTKGRTAETPVKEKQSDSEGAPPAPPPKAINPIVVTPATPQYGDTPNGAPPPSSFRGHPQLAVPASTVKANKVMQWFRSRSRGRSTDDEAEKGPGSGIEVVPRDLVLSPSGPVNGSVNPVTPTSPLGHPQRSPSTHTDTQQPSTFADRLVNNIRPGAKKSPHEYPDIRKHHGPLDHSTVTTRPPPDVMKHVKIVLEGMGVEIYIETEYKYRCIRPKRRKAGNGIGLGLREGSVAAFSMVGSAASNGVSG